MGRLTKPDAPGIGSKGFFGSAAVPLAGFVIQAAFGLVPGFSANITGYAGDCTVGPGFTGSVLSGSPAPVFNPPTNLAFGDGSWGGYGGVALPIPYFGVSQDGVDSQNRFTSVTINGTTYLTAAADFFANGGGCGPTLWAWATPAGLIAGHAYSAVFA